MLKKYLLWLFVLLVWFIGFSNAWSFTWQWVVNSASWANQDISNSSWCDMYLACTFNNTWDFTFFIRAWYNKVSWWTTSTDMYWTVLTNHSFIYHYTGIDNCSSIYRFSFNYWNGSNFVCSVYWPSIVDICPECQECETCPEINTWDILSWSCDINYCVENNLCPISSWSWSELKINDIVHEWKPLINVSIPDNIYWDYSTDENQFDLYVWSWYDQDYIDSILKINSYRPDNEDFTNIFVSWLTLIFPYIFVALLIVFIWKLLKRIFK